MNRSNQFRIVRRLEWYQDTSVETWCFPMHVFSIGIVLDIDLGKEDLFAIRNVAAQLHCIYYVMVLPAVCERFYDPVFFALTDSLSSVNFFMH